MNRRDASLTGTEANVAVARPSFLEQVQGLIERTYRFDRRISDVGSFIIGEEGFRRIYEDPEPPQTARLLLRLDASGQVRARLFFPRELLKILERNHPLRSIHSGNVDALGTLVEELDHLLLLAERSRRGWQTSLLEMEFQANVTKLLVTGQLMARHMRRPLDTQARSWVRWHVLEKGTFSDPDRAVRHRYEEARRLARKVADHLERLEPAHRLVWLRRFARTPGPRRLREADRLAA